MSSIDGILSFETNCYSYTGVSLYSDTFIKVTHSQKIASIQPFLNKFALIPILGNLAGFARIALSLIHMIGHFIAFLITQKKGHLYHVFKGAAELLRGVIEILPILGTLFVWYFDSRMPLCCDEKRSNFVSHSVFLVRISNPEAPDFIDVHIKNLDPRFYNLSSLYIK